MAGGRREGERALQYSNEQQGNHVVTVTREMRKNALVLQVDAEN
jgi:hypothetical protein